jgi:hypothetical protein
MLDVYADLRRGPWERLVRPVLQDIPASWLAERTGLSKRTIQRLRNGHSRPRKQIERLLTSAAIEFARQESRSRSPSVPPDDWACLSLYISSFTERS